MKVLVFDTETSDLPVKNSSIYETNNWPYILQLSYILLDTDTNKIITYKNDYVNIPDHVVISEGSHKIQEISREKCNELGKPILVLLEEFNKCLIDANIIVGHNISFDKRMVFVECIRNNYPQYFTQFMNNTKIQKPEYCTMKNTVDLCKLGKINNRNNNLNINQYKYPTLKELYMKLFNTAPNNLHDSIIDVLITLRCYMQLIHNIDIYEANTELKELFEKFEIHNS